MEFEIIGEIRNIETFAVNTSIRDRARLKRMYGAGRWRKLKGIARVRLQRLRLMQRKRKKEASPEFVVCIDNSSYLASLELHKIYRVLSDEDAAQDGDLRVIDESGEDYLYSADRFIAINVPKDLERAILKAS